MTAQLASDWQSTPPAFLNNSGLKRIPRNPKFTSGFHPEPKNGFHPAVFIQRIVPKALQPMGYRERGLRSKVRLLLIPSYESLLDLPIEHTTVNRFKPKKSQLLQNRKTASYKGSINHKGTVYEVLAGENQGIYLSVVRKMIDQLEICKEKWGRVFVVRLEMRQKFYTGNNKLVSRFICNFKKKLLKEYGIREIGFVWAREIETAKHQHYHLAVFLDGYKVKSSWKTHALAKEVWVKIKVGNWMPYVKGKVSYDIRKGDEETKAEAIRRISYLAKTRGKGYRDPQAKDYSTSRLIPKCKGY